MIFWRSVCEAYAIFSEHKPLISQSEVAVAWADEEVSDEEDGTSKLFLSHFSTHNFMLAMSFKDTLPYLPYAFFQAFVDASNYFLCSLLPI